jgi:hypothetical protein
MNDALAGALVALLPAGMLLWGAAACLFEEGLFTPSY